MLWREIYHREGLLKIFGSRGIKKRGGKKLLQKNHIFDCFISLQAIFWYNVSVCVRVCSNWRRYTHTHIMICV